MVLSVSVDRAPFQDGRTDGRTPECLVEQCQHRRLMVGGAVRRTRLGPIRQMTEGEIP